MRNMLASKCELTFNMQKLTVDWVEWLALGDESGEKTAESRAYAKGIR